ncbi:MAG TPA: hypothetical protein EYQ02_03050, partial [Microbacterium sp.]|nr:hypothetical protein [Microbacterium sp.]
MTDAGLLSPRFDDLGVRLHDGGGTLRVWSAHASSIDLLIFDNDDLDWVIETVPLARTDGDIWSAYAAGLRPGTHYAIQVDGPQGPGNTFNPSTLLIDPYARGLACNGFRGWRSVVVAGDFDPAEMARRIETNFGSIPAGSRPPEVMVREEAPRGPKRIEITRPARLPFVALTHPT